MSYLFLPTFIYLYPAINRVGLFEGKHYHKQQHSEEALTWTTNSVCLLCASTILTSRDTSEDDGKNVSLSIFKIKEYIHCTPVLCRYVRSSVISRRRQRPCMLSTYFSVRSFSYHKHTSMVGVVCRHMGIVGHGQFVHHKTHTMNSTGGS